MIRSVKGARNHLVSLEALSDEELAELEKEFARLRERSEQRLARVNGAQVNADAAPAEMGAGKA